MMIIMIVINTYHDYGKMIPFVKMSRRQSVVQPNQKHFLLFMGKVDYEYFKVSAAAEDERF